MSYFAIFADGTQEEFSYDSGSLLGRGATGRVYAAPNFKNGQYVLKLYDNPRELDVRRLKILVVANPVAESAEGLGKFQFVWPIAAVSSSRRVEDSIGFLMPRIDFSKTDSIEKCFRSPLRRNVKNPYLSLERRIKIAINYSMAVSVLHRNGILITDFNPANFRISPESSEIFFFDCDSYGVRHGNTDCPPTHFTPGMISPELLGSLPSRATKEQDLFGLAVIIFKILNFGIHPFQGVRKQTTERNSDEDNVREGLYAYGISKPSIIDPHPLSIHESFPPALRSNFHAAFKTYARPSAEKWHQYFSDLEINGKLDKCSDYPEKQTHIRFKGMPCGLCRLEKRSPAPSANAPAKSVPASAPKPLSQIPDPFASQRVSSTPPGAVSVSTPGSIWPITVALFFIILVAILANNSRDYEQHMVNTDTNQRKELMRKQENDSKRKKMRNIANGDKVQSEKKDKTIEEVFTLESRAKKNARNGSFELAEALYIEALRNFRRIKGRELFSKWDDHIIYILKSLGRIKYLQKNYLASFDYYYEILKTDNLLIGRESNEEVILLSAGLMKLKLKEPQKAIKYFKKAYKLNDKNNNATNYYPHIMNGLGTGFYAQLNNVASIQAFCESSRAIHLYMENGLNIGSWNKEYRSVLDNNKKFINEINRRGTSGKCSLYKRPIVDEISVDPGDKNPFPPTDAEEWNRKRERALRSVDEPEKANPFPPTDAEEWNRKRERALRSVDEPEKANPFPPTDAEEWNRKRERALRSVDEPEKANPFPPTDVEEWKRMRERAANPFPPTNAKEWNRKRENKVTSGQNIEESNNEEKPIFTEEDDKNAEKLVNETLCKLFNINCE
jgi:tetratricopeptide (TPR) repeat protein